MTSALAARPAVATTIAAPPVAPFAWPPGRALLTAEWRHLVMLNYEIEPGILAPLVPVGTQLDLWHGSAYVSIVGFLFRRSRLFGVPIPFHGSFEEVNLRFYVRREVDDEIRRGVVFVRELAPRRAVAVVANALYGEKYLTVPMSHCFNDGDPHDNRPPRQLEYRWNFVGRTHRVSLETRGEPQPLKPGSHEEFIAEHYWGYTALPRSAANEYQVAHPPWNICPAAAAEFDCDVAAHYGPQFVPFLSSEPTSAFWANGSPVRVYPGRRVVNVLPR